MRKSLLVVSHALELGGAEMSLIGLLDALDPSEWDIDLFLLRHEGELMGEIPSHVNLLPQVSAYSVPARPMKSTLKEGHILLTAARLFGRLAATRYIRKNQHTDSVVPIEYSHKYTCPLMPVIQADKTYDMAISFLTPHYYVAKKVNAKRKLAWIHTDYSRVQVNYKSEFKMWDAYDHIVSISDAVSEGFLKTFPSLKAKLVVIENILPEKMVRKRAALNCADMQRKAGETVLLSVGRFCTAKNFDNVPDICARLRKIGHDVKWYLIGFGGDEELIRQKIQESNMEEHVIILGKKANPYPYIQNCDLYVQPSRYEGKCVSVREAQMLTKPVVITRYATSSSQLEEGVDGLIVPMDNEGCAAGIAALLSDPQKMQNLVDACKMRNYCNSQEARVLGELV